MILAARGIGFVDGGFANWTLFFWGVFEDFDAGVELPDDGGRHTTQYVICR